METDGSDVEKGLVLGAAVQGFDVGKRVGEPVTGDAYLVGCLLYTSGVQPAGLRQEFGPEPVARAMETVGRLAESGLLTSDGETVRLTARGRLLSNDVFQEFLETAAEESEVGPGA